VGKVAIVGVGNVGSTIAYSLMLDGIVSELALIDIDKEKSEGEALDLSHCKQFTNPIVISAGDSFDLVQNADVVIVTAGLSQSSSSQKRADLVEQNSKLFKKIIPQIVSHNKNCVLLVVTNPLDVMTYLSWKLSGFDSCRVFGTGTVLDTARLRFLIGKHFKISPKDINAYVLGEHGDTEFVWWSKANIGGVHLSRFTAYSPKLINDIFEQTKNAAYEIIEKKGATFYAIALVVVKIVRSILLNQSRVFTLSTIIHKRFGIDDIALSLPTIVRRSGICENLDVQLDAEEQEKLSISACKIKENICLALDKMEQ
jgi:L-lactate dehydrogenase